MTQAVLFNNHELIIVKSLAGGDISRVFQIKDPQGRYGVLKICESAPESFFLAEAQGLKLLRNSATGFIVPAVYGASEQGIWLEWIEPGRPDSQSWANAGQALAEQHKHINDQFGLAISNFCGLSPQLNNQVADGFQFFADYRIQPQLKLAADRGYLDSKWLSAGQNFCKNLPELIPEQPASLIHGDLWSGNLMFNSKGRPVLIDPACYFGWAEADLAMTLMFGGFDQEFYQAYQQHQPLIPGFEERISYYNLYHWLNHLNLFGKSYLHQVTQILRPFS